MQHCTSVCRCSGGICSTLTWQCGNTITQSHGKPGPVTLYLPWVKANVCPLTSICPSMRCILWVDEVIFHTTDRASVLGAAFDYRAVNPDFFKWLSGLWRVPVFRRPKLIKIRISASLSPAGSHVVVSLSCTCNWRGWGSVWFQSKLTRVLHYGIDARWQDCSAMLKPASDPV